MEFVPIYLQSEYSMLQSTCSIDKTLKLLKAYGYNSAAITDFGVMHGTLKFYNACKKEGIKPIIGLKVPYCLNGVVSNILLYAMAMISSSASSPMAACGSGMTAKRIPLTGWELREKASKSKPSAIIMAMVKKICFSANTSPAGAE